VGEADRGVRDLDCKLEKSMYGLGILRGLGITLKHFVDSYLDDLKFLGRRYYDSESLKARQGMHGRGIFTAQTDESAERNPVEREERAATPEESHGPRRQAETEFVHDDSGPSGGEKVTALVNDDQKTEEQQESQGRHDDGHRKPIVSGIVEN